MVAGGLVRPERARELFEQVVPELFRYPAIDPGAFGGKSTGVWVTRRPEAVGQEIALRVSSLSVRDDRSPEDLLGYHETGLPT